MGGMRVPANPPRDGEGDRRPQAGGEGGGETLRRPNPPRPGEDLQ
ncbi:MAG: hypothetical protein QOD42_781 [Sphingomonadales bacterium]|jgi:hypothetical protein|nr:hypothetical protein [Sphingomonadales bacterium]